MKFEAIPWTRSNAPREPGLRQELEDEGFEVVSWRDRSDRSYEEHTHRHDESLWILRGTLVLRIDGKEFDLQAGDRIMLPKETVHSAQVGPEGASYLIGQKR